MASKVTSESLSAVDQSAAALPRPHATVRSEFPIFQQSVGQHPLIYLDSAATSQKPEAVLHAMDSYYRETNANVHRGVYGISERATELFEGARSRIAAFVGSTDEETIFTRNATEAINLVSNAWGRDNVGPGDTVLITLMEHHSNIVPWQLLCQERGAKLEYVGITTDGLLDRDDFSAKLVARPKLVAFAHISNVLGTINPVKDLTAEAHAAGATVLVDGSQAVPHLPVNVRDINCDFYVWTGHKALGPTGVGVLHGKRDQLLEMRPWLGGGDMIKVVSFDSSTWNDLPWKFEAGTSAIAEVIGLGAAVDYMTEIGIEQIRDYEHALTAHALERISAMPGLEIYGPDSEHRGSVVSFGIEGMHPHDIAELCSRDGVCVRTGHHCAQPLMRRLDVAATARASFGIYNNSDDVDALITALTSAREVFGL